MRQVTLAMSGVICAVVAAVPSSAQTVVGDVVDDTRSAVVDARIGVFDAEGRLVGQGRTGESGHFRIDVPEPGPHRLHVTRFGYRSLSGGPYDLHIGLELELFVVMHPAPVPVDGIEVELEGRSGRLEIAGFYDRETAGFGYHFDREELERRGSIDVSDFLVRSIPGLEKSPRRARLIGLESMQSDAITFERGPQGCVPAMWVDGLLVRFGGRSSDPLRPDDWFVLSEIEGIEFYGTVSAVPVEFARSANCGVLVVWTRGSGYEHGGGDS